MERGPVSSVYLSSKQVTSLSPLYLPPELGVGIASSTNEGGAATLDSLNLAEVDPGAAEAGRQLAAVKELALGGGDGAQVGARLAADQAYTLAQGTKLLCGVAVAAEGAVRVAVGLLERLGQRAGGRGRVRTRGMVNVG
jgi:hypothetical protein